MIHISSSEALNQSLMQKFPKDTCIFFNEQMEKGTYQSELFSFAFLKERAQVFNLSVEDYSKKMSKFVTFLYTIDLEEAITLWIDSNEFSDKNLEVMLEAIAQKGYQKSIQYNRVISPSTEVLESREISLDTKD